MTGVQIENVVKTYGAVRALDGISLEITRGEIFGLIGPDGAGKTTLFRILCTLLRPDSGTLRLEGRDIFADIGRTRSSIGYMPQRFSLYGDLTVQQNLNFFARLFGVRGEAAQRRLRELYQFSRLSEFKKRKAAALSGGMKQKLALSCALIHAPQLLILDEPTTGVDPLSRQELWELLQKIRQEGKTILVSTPYMDEAALCDRIALVHQGQVVGVGTAETIRQSYPHPLFQIKAQNLHQAEAFFKALPQVVTVRRFGDVLHVSLEKIPGRETWDAWREKSGGNLLSWRPQDPGIEDVFLELMPNRERDG